MDLLGDVSADRVSVYELGVVATRWISGRIHEILECVMGDAMSAHYEVIGHNRQVPCYARAETLPKAKELRDQMFATGDYYVVLIRQYFINQYGRDAFRVLHKLSLRTTKETA